MSRRAALAAESQTTPGKLLKKSRVHLTTPEKMVNQKAQWGNFQKYACLKTRPGSHKKGIHFEF